jgi:hypothetical protein
MDGKGTFIIDDRVGYRTTGTDEYNYPGSYFYINSDTFVAGIVYE